MLPHGDQKGGSVELTHLIEIGLWQSMLDSLSAQLQAGIRILNADKEIILQSGIAGLCREAMRRAPKHPACFRCCDIEDPWSYGEGGFALCAYCDRILNFVFNLQIDGIQGHVIVGPVWIAEKGIRTTAARLARRFGTGQAKFAQLSVKLKSYSIEDFRKAGQMVSSTMRVIAQTLGTSLELVKEVGELKNALLKEKKKTWQQMVRDELTGTYRYNYGLARLKEEVARAERYKQSLSIVVIGIGKFRSYVDQYGPDAVDALLRGMGTLVQTKSRRTDVWVRLREEEFLLVLPFTAQEGARAMLDRLRREIETLSLFTRKGSKVEPPSVLEGVASYPTDGENERELLQKALESVRQ